MTPRNEHEARRWMDQALEDLASARVLLEGGRFYLVCFVAHQVAEKAIKAYLYGAGEEAVIGHGIEQLSKRAAGYDPEFNRLREQASILDTYYIPTRYPNGLPDGIPATAYNRDAAEGALRLAQAVTEFIGARLKP